MSRGRDRRPQKSPSFIQRVAKTTTATFIAAVVLALATKGIATRLWNPNDCWILRCTVFDSVHSARRKPGHLANVCALPLA